MSFFSELNAAFRDPVRRRFFWRSLMGIAIAWVVASSAMSTFTRHYKIGLDFEDVRCMPWMVYFIKFEKPVSIDRGKYVAFVPVGQEMGGRFSGKMIGKMIAGLPGDEIVVANGRVTVAGRDFGELNPIVLSKLGKKASDFDRVEVIPSGKVAVMGLEPRSYDSRYWGSLDQNHIIGSVRPLY